MAIIINRRDPFAELLSLREAMGRLFDESFVSQELAAQPRGAVAKLMPIDLYEENGNYIIRAYLPGVKAEQMEISADKNSVTVTARVSEGAEEGKSENLRWLMKELEHGQVTRTVSLPAPIDADKVDAALEDGVLSVTIPQAEEARPRQIAVKAG
ncbi:MAG: Hsp20/alpha crystallin family protein [Dehalococcoidia bacterium]|nr:Hsp20/alpha crystallin family protein [Dehalococcoidia bacterium]